MRARALTRAGAAAALALGTLTYAAGGRAFTLILLAFFVPSVALGRVGRRRKRELTDIGKGGARDAWQVLANGGVATAGALVATWRSASSPLRNPWFAAFAGAYAAATADTWGTEIGTLVPGAPRSILTFKPIATGLSGGVTFAGSAAEVAGAAWIAACAVIASPHEPVTTSVAAWEHDATRAWCAVAAGGVAGALIDSVLGATVQELRRCPSCERYCETNPHVCGGRTEHVRGIAGISNDAVNFCATVSGAIVAFAIASHER